MPLIFLLTQQKYVSLFCGQFLVLRKRTYSGGVFAYSWFYKKNITGQLCKAGSEYLACMILHRSKSQISFTRAVRVQIQKITVFSYWAFGLIVKVIHKEFTGSNTHRSRFVSLGRAYQLQNCTLPYGCHGLPQCKGDYDPELENC